MRAPVFDDLLDEHLAAVPPSLSGSWAPGPSGTAPAYGFFFGLSSVVVASPVGNPHVSALARSAKVDLFVLSQESRPSTVAQGVPNQVDRRSTPVAPGRVAAATPIIEPVLPLLSTAERAALAEMNALGSNLSPAFTFGELRRAFRTLALRYHPDRHTSRSADERAELSDRFTRARRAYQILIAVSGRRV